MEPISWTALFQILIIFAGMGGLCVLVLFAWSKWGPRESTLPELIDSVCQNQWKITRTYKDDHNEKEERLK